MGDQLLWSFGSLCKYEAKFQCFVINCKFCCKGQQHLQKPVQGSPGSLPGKQPCPCAELEGSASPSLGNFSLVLKKPKTKPKQKPHIKPRSCPFPVSQLSTLLTTEPSLWLWEANTSFLLLWSIPVLYMMHSDQSIFYLGGLFRDLGSWHWLNAYNREH